MTDTLRSICEQSTHLNNPQLDFIPDNLPRHKEIILRNLKELIAAASAELEKTVVILAGSTLEAILYSFIQSQESYIAGRRGEFTFNPEHSLQNYVSIFNRWFRGQFPAAQLPDFIVDYRDLVHLNRELNSPPHICAEASRSMLNILNAFLGQLGGVVPHSKTGHATAV
jgi:hypothetical protein